MSATSGDVFTAIRTSFSGCPPDWWSQGILGVDELEDRVEEHFEFGDDAELESEIEAIVGTLQSSCDLETNQEGDETGETQSTAEGAGTPTHKQ